MTGTSSNKEPSAPPSAPPASPPVSTASTLSQSLPELASKTEVTLCATTPTPSSSSESAAAAESEASGCKRSGVETLTVSIPVVSGSVFTSVAGDSGIVFSQIVSGTMASPMNSSTIVAVPVVAVPCFIGPAGLPGSVGFTGQFAMTHQAVLATVTAQAQIQLQAGCLPSPDHSNLPASSPISPTLLQQPRMIYEENTISPRQHSASVKSASSDGYNWRKYGQKQVKISDNSRSYYRCTHANCCAKKKIEHRPDGYVTEIVYRGEHNHDPPQKSKSSKERGPQSSGPLVVKKNIDIPRLELNTLDPCTSKKENDFCNEMPVQVHCSSDCEGDAGTNTEDDDVDEPHSKRRQCVNPTTSLPLLKTVKEPKVVVQAACDSGRVNDGYRWRKYGQKIVKGNPNPRSYYKCTNMGCPVRKHVEKASKDANMFVITYEGQHNHGFPPLRNGSETPNSNALATKLFADAAEAVMTSDEQMHDSSSLSYKEATTRYKMEKDGETTDERALELGGMMALESAETLLSIGCHPTSGENNKEYKADAIQRPFFDGNRSVVQVKNT